MKKALILHPTDFSDCAQRAGEQAVRLAEILPGRIHLLHKVIYPAPEAPRDILRQLQDVKSLETLLQDYLEGPQGRARERLERAAEEIRSRGIEVETSIEPSRDPFEAITLRAAALHADLIVMGTHGRTGAEKVLIGSVAEKVLRQAPCDVMTVRADSAIFGAQDAFGRILVPVDFSDYSQRAVVAARRMISAVGGDLVLLHVVEPVHAAFHPGGFLSRLESDPELAERYRTALEGMRDTSPGQVLLVEGNVGAKILEVREQVGAKLVVMGTRGLSGLKRFLRGSVAEKIARFCEVPLLTVK
jgi:nucleotide-binding universal stress UspA family protein